MFDDQKNCIKKYIFTLGVRGLDHRSLERNSGISYELSDLHPEYGSQEYKSVVYKPDVNEFSYHVN